MERWSKKWIWYLNILNKGEERYTDGNFYKGEFLNGKKNGKGSFYLANGTFYEGDFKDDKLEGNVWETLKQGVFTWTEQKIYRGEWKNNTLTGFGVYSQPGKIYKGYFFDDKKHGYGIYLLDNNEIIIGNWIQDHLDGLSILIDKDGNEHLFVSRKKREKKKVVLNEEKETHLKSEGYKKLKGFYQNAKNRGLII